jgi:hypothetical protein
MARVTHVKKAQQRYGTKPVLDEDGKPKRTQVMKNGEPNEIGTPYKWIQPKTSANGGRKRSRHESCPNWKVWEYSNSWSARIAQAVDGFSVDNAESEDDVTSALDDVAAAIEELAEESATSASSMEDGFGHSTSQSEEAAERAESLETWAGEIKDVTIPDLPEPEPRWFVTNGDGVPSDLFEEDGYDSESDAEHALAMHRDDNRPEGAEDETEDDNFEIEEITPDEPSEEQLNDWRDEVRDACSIVDESPI